LGLWLGTALATACDDASPARGGLFGDQPRPAADAEAESAPPDDAAISRDARTDAPREAAADAGRDAESDVASD
jgi:hypothetical protein